MLRNRQNVLMVSYDLPTTDKTARKEYRNFHKYLKTSGYIMLQQSLYIKLLHFGSNAAAEIKDIHLNAPLDGNIIALQLSLRQFRKMKQLRGNEFDFSWFSDDLLCV